MADFEIAYKRTVQFEGGYTNNPDDNGNWTGGLKGSGILIGTNHGISAPLFKQYLGRTPSAEEMRSLSLTTAKAIYVKEFWNRMRGSEINNQEVANSIFDSCVNMGVTRGIKLAQRALDVPETGGMNDITLKTLNNA